MMNNSSTPFYSRYKCHFWNIAKASILGASTGAGIGYLTQESRDYQCGEYVNIRNGKPDMIIFDNNRLCLAKLAEMGMFELMQLGRYGYIKIDSNPIWVLSLILAGAIVGAALGAYHSTQVANNELPRLKLK